MPRGGKCAVPSPAQGGPESSSPVTDQSDVLGSGRVSHAPGVPSPPFRPVGQSGPDPGRRPPSLRITVRLSLLVDLD
ncbi:hypothetical protein IscW_ISCW013548 [Ixodes scapularis]|uniref:Uncharacterized protein n=1 Tax=Ixodes scapularis TaxID=6945 RepID=B7QLB6_IXOSC|nr:hypothetical protein IscW_ISCW013548 [Ixodes scapularis]|eukprot:XP_002415971.1 hypothetical protein IscW_ISCW013548 [Ixodes scapularis]